MPVTIKLDPQTVSLQAQIIPNASCFNDGVMSKEQACKLDGISPGGGTLTQSYDLGTTAADQTLNISAAKGGGLVAKAAAVAVGSLLRALTSASAVVFDAIDAAFPKVLAAGAFIQNDPGFGSPVMGSQTNGGFMSYTGDGIGATWGGTGVTAKNVGGGSPMSLVVMTVEDNPIFTINQNGMESVAGKTLGIDGTGVLQPVSRIAGDLYDTSVGAPLLVVANTITPTNGVHHVDAGVISTITPPFSDFRGSITLIPDNPPFTYNGAGNISPAGGGAAISNQPMIATYDGTKWYMSY